MRRVTSGLRAVAMPILTLLLPLAGCDRVFGLIDVQPVEEDEGQDNGYACTCTCTYDGDNPSTLQLDVCMPADLNPNLTGQVPAASALAEDCEDRVTEQIDEMVEECYEGQNIDCDCVVNAPLVTFFDSHCNDGCPKVPIVGACTNWDPNTGAGEATCAEDADCDAFGPVCLRSMKGTGQVAPTPISARLMGRTTTCTLTSGELTLGLDDETESAPLAGALYFTPSEGCGSGETCLTMDYRFRTTGTLAFDGIPILGIGDTDIEGVVTTGATDPFPLGTSNTSFLPSEAVDVSARAFENGDRRAATGSNTEPLVVTFDGETCTIQGNLAGRAGDPDGDSGEATVHVFASGVVTNSPPVAAVTSVPALECTSPGGAEVSLDATASTDREGNIVSYGWYLGDRVGPVIGLDPVLVTQQSLGSETYVLKVIDAGMQSDERTVNVSVADTTGPDLDCGAPSTITPDGTPYTFEATATDACDDALGQPEILEVDCFAINGAGKEVERSCRVEIAGDTLTIRSSGGVGNHFRWQVRATDASGNATTATCETVVVNPGHN